jgi:hypothetical protein
VERGLSHDSFTRQKGLRNLFCKRHRPVMVAVPPIRKCDKKARIGNSLQERENPFREDRSGSPDTVPASRMNARFCDFLALSSSVLMIFPFLIFVLRDVSSSHSSISSVRRIVIVRLISNNRITICWNFKLSLAASIDHIMVCI